MQIHICHAGQQSGPHTLDEVRNKLQTGALLLTDMAWHEGVPQWIPVSQLPGLAATVRSVPVSGVVPPPIPKSSPPRRGPILGAAVGTMILTAAMFIGGLLMLIEGGEGGWPVLGLFLILFSVASLFMGIQLFLALSQNPTGCCQVCGQFRPTIRGSLNRHIGAIVLMFHRSLNGHMCKSCLSTVFWQYTLLTLAAGWWGFLSFFITPLVLINNVAFYVRSRFMK